MVKNRTGIFPLSFAFRSTSPMRAFILAAIIQAAITMVTLRVHDGLQDKTSNTYWTFQSLLRESQSPWLKSGIIFVSAFIATMLVMNTMWALFAYGGSMLTSVAVSEQLIRWV
jgi:hypothetical protein